MMMMMIIIIYSDGDKNFHVRPISFGDYSPDGSGDGSLPLGPGAPPGRKSEGRSPQKLKQFAGIVYRL